MKMKNNMRVDSILSFFRKRMVRKPCKTCGKKIMKCRNCLKENVKLIKKWYVCPDCKYEWENRK